MRDALGRVEYPVPTEKRRTRPAVEREIGACKLLRNREATLDRTDNLIIANDVVLRYSALIPEDL